MKTFVVLSDSHGRKKNVEKLLALFAENDFVVHLGDGSAVGVTLAPCTTR